MKANEVYFVMGSWDAYEQPDGYYENCERLIKGITAGNCEIFFAKDIWARYTGFEEIRRKGLKSIIDFIYNNADYVIFPDKIGLRSLNCAYSFCSLTSNICAKTISELERDLLDKVKNGDIICVRNYEKEMKENEQKNS